MSSPATEIPGSSSQTVAVYYHPAVDCHDTGADHPEQHWRAAAVKRGLLDSSIAYLLDWREPEPAALNWIETVHTAEYMRFVEESALSGHRFLDFGETVISEESFEAARLSVGGALEAVDAVMSGECPAAFSCMRPPGHHARSEAAMGFCVFNNVAIAARYARTRYNLDRVCILDWDVHHGNGTQDTFYRDPTVLFVSLHESPLYPYTGHLYEKGSGPGHSFNINLPLPPGAGFDWFERELRTAALPAMEAYQPELILLSAGFDAHLLDPLANLELEARDFHEMTKLVLEVADKCCGGRVVSLLEGGYDPNGLVESAVAHVAALCRVDLS